MGIKGFLKLFKREKVTLGSMGKNGCKIGIDGLCILYRLSWNPNISYELCCKNPYNPKLLIKRFIEWIKSLQLKGYQIIIVFDNKHDKGGWEWELPMKKDETEKRMKKYEVNKEKLEKMIKNNDDLNKIKKFSRCCVRINQEIINLICKELKDNKISYMIAPYESDPQLVYLQKIGMIQYIITEDSDLIAYGGKDLIYKLELSSSKQCKFLHFKNWNDNLKQEYNYLKNFTNEKKILLGCLFGNDFITNIRSVGFKKSLNIIKKYHNSTKKDLFEYLTNAYSSKLVDDYFINFEKCIDLYTTCRVFCPQTKNIVPFDINEKKKVDLDEWKKKDYLGEWNDELVKFCCDNCYLI